MPTRRSVVALGGLGAMFPAAGATFSRDLSPTPSQRIGPFYPEPTAAESRLDLVAPGSAGEGRRVELSGRLVDPSGQPIGSALVMVWQADPLGRYDHSGDPRRAERLAGLAGHGLMRTDRDGGFHLRTLRPGPYADSRSVSGLRTPHIHFEFIGEVGRLITEMYFPGEPLNRQDANIAEMVAEGGDSASLTATSLGEGDVQALGWRVVLGAR